MSTSLRVVPPVAPEVTALAATCRELARAAALDRFEIAVQGRMAAGINNDNDLRDTDDLNHQMVLQRDALDHARKDCDPRIAGPITAAHALHKSLISTVKPWKDRWDKLISTCDRLAQEYKRAQRELKERQQREIDRVVEEQKRQKEAEARALLRAGEVTAAQSLIHEAQTTVAPVISTATPVLDHSSDRKVWEILVADPIAACRAIADGVIPVSAIKEWNKSFLKAEAKSRGGLNWPGIEAWQEDAVTHRR